MSLVVNGKYVYDASGKVVEVILPIQEFWELRRRAGKTVTAPAQSGASAQPREDLSAMEMTQIAQFGGAFDWLEDEPDLYSEADGEPI
jgi:hypothetical protein